MGHSPARPRSAEDRFARKPLPTSAAPGAALPAPLSRWPPPDSSRIVGKTLGKTRRWISRPFPEPLRRAAEARNVDAGDLLADKRDERILAIGRRDDAAIRIHHVVAKMPAVGGRNLALLDHLAEFAVVESLIADEQRDLSL